MFPSIICRKNRRIQPTEMPGLSLRQEPENPLHVVLQHRGWRYMKAPMLIFRAESDQYVSLDALKCFAEKIQKHGIVPCEYVMIPGTRHELYSTPDAVLQDYMERILRFLSEG